MRNFLLTLLTFWPALLSAQQRTLTGRVASSTGEPVRGANVFLLETLDGTITGCWWRWRMGQGYRESEWFASVTGVDDLTCRCPNIS
jgi:hypothetical protein